ncbi:metallophosphatase [Aureimonas sp. SA4125]|uniref:ligase-associated DNA damage response endonuclease PdeM n=1 Tax=Aureimonas sp. SA4125 TaxID=2826993 RepID=UPI001CC3B870|nr:ligase-associated DNA damage response endonuclease PdeM [Aureimonas sp. SA4125]BDA83198.1 metallophosphatase [Aureimonas sp. SA4125]
MNAVVRRMRQAECEGHAAALNGGSVVCDPSGALYCPDERLLVVSDLHLEKGAAFARRGMMMPPYDTAATLALLGAVIGRYDPARVVCLGDSFHDRHGAAFMPAAYREILVGLMAGRDWTWISGNHDPEPPAFVGGETLGEIAIGPWHFRHEPRGGARPGEVAGHLHPMARVAGGGRSVCGACFATDGERMVMPSFGVTTGGLNVLDRAFHGLFRTDRAMAHVIGVARIYPIRFRALCH